MSSTDFAPKKIDEELSRRIDRLAARRNGPEIEIGLDTDMAARIAQLANRNSQPAPPAPADGQSRSPKPRAARRRRHPAKKSRIAALALSLATTGGLATAFAAMDSPSSAIVTAEGGVITNTPASPLVTATDSATSDARSTAAAATVNGNVYNNKWGPVQVQATFAADGTLTSVDAVQAPFADGKSVRINDRAVPVLNSEALTNQTAQVDTVSGATYTSVDYERSLQSAIDTARAAGLTELI